ncbi:MOP flippase family protein [Campylobacter sp. RM9344]|uniref:MOP flippase family protein n=1 Tax=Campylobacter californiensis TaxID=1032243 RepID=A0AAW3ZSU5_9BACT|nr:MOP flippase family protein [Campylobacter sp. RM9337]MBE3028728.1 MOP flippase family protein [Campylobacter sp. RM9344]MBE3607617.1 MOP flippase family protein [Campylobacter sp. RM9337]
MKFKTQVVSGVRWTSISVIAKAVLQLIQLMVLVRFLDKSDFGIMAILMIFINFSQVFVDFGISKAIVHYQNISRSDLGTLYCVNVLFGLLIYCGLFICSEYIAFFYGEPLLIDYLRIIGIILVIQSFGLQFDVLFQKSLKFNIIAKIEIFAVFVSFCLSIILAVNNFGVMALIYPMIAMTIIKTFIFIFFGIKEYGFSFAFNIKCVRKYIVFGSYSVGDSVVSTISGQMDVILIGKFIGVESLGIYNVLKDFILRSTQIINPIVTKVAFPLMSKINDNLNSLKYMYLKIINYTSSIAFPVYTIAIVMAEDILYVLLGEKWISQAILLRILAVWAMFYSISSPVGALIMAAGKPNVSFYWNSTRLIYMPVVVYISSFWGEIGVAVGMLIVSLLLYIPGWYFLIYRICNASLKEYSGSLLKSFCISTTIGIVVYFFIEFISNNLYIKLFFVLPLGFLILLFLNKYLNKDFYNAILDIIRK